MNTKKTVGVGLLAAGAAAGLGYYFYASKNAGKNRRIVAKWASDMKGDVVKQAKRVGDLDRDSVLSLIDKASNAYETARGIDKKDLQRAAGELRKNWGQILKEVQGKAGKVATKVAKRTLKKASKKAGKKAR